MSTAECGTAKTASCPSLAVALLLLQCVPMQVLKVSQGVPNRVK